MSKIRLPIGIQNFETLIGDGFTYIDKTKYIYELAHGESRAYFLSRPRRFGKSLFLSTLKAYWEGKKDLFKGFVIEQLEQDGTAWEPHPVLYFDFNKNNYMENESLEAVLDEHLKEWEQEYGVESTYQDGRKYLPERFRAVIKRAYEKTGKRVVILVDEYDKPLLENGGTDERMEHDRAVYKGFFSTLKSYDEFIKFSFLTGVTKFSKVSIFSDLNHLTDISITKKYAGICGITEEEIRDNLDERVEEMAVSNGLTKDECYAELKKMYDGYHFYQDAVGVYNPFSLLNALSTGDFNAWWFETGTPTFLIKKIKEAGYDFTRITEADVYASEAMIKDYRVDNPDPVPLLYQSGYLTIISYDSRRRRYVLGYPNEEVKYGLIEGLSTAYLGDKKNSTNSFNIYIIDDYIEKGDTDGLRDALTALYASLPYPTSGDIDRQVEQNFQNVAYLVFTLLGQFVRTEVHSAKGRSDVIVETDDYVYIMEFKRDSSAEDALAQIEDMSYAAPYAADKRTLIKIGANFDSEKRTLDGWEAI